ncbi:MAG: dihydrodipicolinate reductase C-terminal domain-containing protein [Ornithinimicrobium sp.]
MACTVGLFGRGRLGSLIADAIDASPDLQCAWRLGRGETPEGDVDVAIDVSHPDAVGEHIRWADDTTTDLVIGATGWPAQALRNTGRFSAVLIAPNFSMSMALMHRLAAVLGGYAARHPGPVDLAVTEAHHRGKVDSPSGSATMLIDALAHSARRPTAEIATTSLRMGSIIGQHDVHWETATETIQLSHVARSRDVFADGALAAARWIRGRTGVFTLDDWAADQLDDLFAPHREPCAEAARSTPHEPPTHRSISPQEHS